MTRTFPSISGWIEDRTSNWNKTGSFILSSFCDFVAPHGGVISLGGLIDSGALVGITEQNIRSSVNRLVGDGWLSKQAIGRRSYFRLSDAGARRYDLVRRRLYHDDEATWTGRWQIIISCHSFEAPETSANLFRDFQWIGFGKVAENVYVRPERSGNDVKGEAVLGLPSTMVSFVGSSDALAAPMESLVAQAWDLEMISARYRTFVDRTEWLLKQLRRKTTKISGALALAVRSLVIHDFRRVRLADPLLPGMLLPKDWPGDRAYAIMKELYGLLSLPSEQYIMETMTGLRGKLPPADNSFGLRFGGLPI